MRIVSGRETISLRVDNGTALCAITDQHGAEVHRAEVSAQTHPDVQRLVQRCAAIVASVRDQRELDTSSAVAEPARRKLWAGIWSWFARHIRPWLTYAARS